MPLLLEAQSQEGAVRNRRKPVVSFFSSAFVSRALKLLGALVCLSGCGRDAAFVDPTPIGEDTDTANGGGQTVVRGDLVVQVTVDPQDSGIATALGFPALALPGANVIVRRFGLSLLSDVSSDSGMVFFQALVTGSWDLSAIRLLTPEERSSLPAGAEDVTGFSAGQTVSVGEGETLVALRATVGRTGSLVISEVFPAVVRTQAGEDYTTGQYFEIMNNGFRTEYLDGVLIGFLYNGVRESNVSSCEDMARWREDSLGVWVRYFATFPGSGQQFPVSPGEAVLIATDAIDHREFVPTLLDLSGADYEFSGSADVDNPLVPNMLNTGLAEWAPPVGHGLSFSFLAIQVFLAAPLDPDTLPREEALPNQDHVRIPREAVLDVFTSRMPPERDATLSTEPCARMTHPVFDQQHAELFDYTQPVGIRRRALSGGADPARVILGRTRNSKVDFETAIPTPDRVP